MSRLPARHASDIPSLRLAVAAALALVLALPISAAAQLAGGQRIGDSTDPTAASISMSMASTPDGTARRVVLGRNDSFPDNLAGAAVAGDGGVLLLVEPASSDTPGLSDAVGAEIRRLLPSDPPETCGTGLDAEVILLGGPAALSPDLEADLADDFCVDRLAGASRNDTSVAAANAVVAAGGGQRGLLLVAVDDNPADSAAAGAYAAATNTPIVVTPGNRLDQSVAALLAPGEDPWDNVILLGGEAALSAEVMTLIQEAAGAGTPVTRVAGQTRDDTALQVIPGLWGDAAQAGVAIVNGIPENFWVYALPGGVAAGQQGFPLLYVRSASVPDTTGGYLQANGPSVITVGPASVLTDEAKNAAEALAAGGGGTTPPPADGDLRVVPVDLAPAGDSFTATVAIAAGDYSVTMTARAADGTSQVFNDAITGPNTTIGQNDVQQAGLYGDSAITFPFLPGQTLSPGDYTFTFFTEGAGGVVNAQAIIKSGDPNARMLLDATFYDVTSDHPSIDEAGEQQALLDSYRQTGEQIFGQQDLGVGDLNFVAADDLKGQYAELLVPANDEGNPVNIRGLCGALQARSENPRALAFAIVDRISDIGGNDGGGETEGIAAGIPGTPFLADVTNSCVIIIADGGRPITQLGTTTWHEAGHFLGLFHTTEQDGASFDPLPDTPECPDTDGDGSVDEGECGPTSQNFMFYDSDSTNMTADQAFVMRRSPLLRPAAAG